MAKARCSLFCIYEDLYLLDRNKEEVIELYFYSAKKSANLHALISSAHCNPSCFRPLDNSLASGTVPIANHLTDNEIYQNSFYFGSD